MRGGRGGHMRTSVRLLTVIVLATLGTIGAAHATAGNPVWLSAGSAAEIAQRKVDLIAFLLSIDAETTEQAIPAGWDGCP